MIFVAKSYEGLEKIGEPYLKSGRSYIKVLTKTGQEKEVRVYTEKEYNKMYPEAKVSSTGGKGFGPQMNCLGFKDKEDYIIFFVGDIAKNEEWFNQRIQMRYHRVWGWYVVDKIYPAELPDNVYPCKLPWSAVGQDDGYLKPEADMIKEIIKLTRGVKKNVGK